MARVKQGFSRLTVPAQIERGRLIVTKLTGNAAFPTPNPTLVTLTTAIDALETAYNDSRGRDHVKVELMRFRRAEMLGLFVSEGGYVQTTSAGDAELILSTGFDVVNRGPKPPVGKILNLRVAQGSVGGTLKLEWNKDDSALVYIIQICPDPFSEANFITKAAITQTKFTVSGLTVGTKYWFRVAGIGPLGSGDWSEPAGLVVEK